MTEALTMATLPLIILAIPLVTKNILPPMKLETSIKMALLASIPPTILALKSSPQSLSIHPTLTTAELMNITTTFTTNQYSYLFLPIAFLVTWSIMQFSSWYIPKNKLTKSFQKLLLVFLIMMIVLATAGSLLQLLIGWEGVGIMSFLLINWWFSRPSANTAALQAIIYNRIGDIGLIVVMAVFAMEHTSWTTEQILATNTKTLLIASGLILAAIGKSAQFLMHMWLPSAMEGPTPVSALLHSSTMVVAGVYLLSQLHPMLNFNPPMTACLWLGTTTSLYAAFMALSQSDMKKIIAFSTSSQLGLMMTAIGANSPHLAILHMLTHATFKATLFLSAGSAIHSMQNEQDIRKMGALKTSLPITTSIITTNGLTLMGLPFLSGFYSKDMIIETLLTSNLNAWALVATILATTMTTSYTLRMMIYTTTKTPNHKPLTSFDEASPHQTLPMIRLTLTTITFGPIAAATIQSATSTLPVSTKLTPLLAITLGTYLALEFTNYQPPINHNHQIYKLSNSLAYFKLTHRTLPDNTLNYSHLLSNQLTDLIWMEKTGPKTITSLNVYQSKTSPIQAGLMTNYLMALLISFTTALMTAII